MPWFRSEDGCRIQYRLFVPDRLRPEVSGVVLVNGTAQTIPNWLPLVRALEPDFPVLSYDARGQGGSGIGAGTLDLDRHVRDLMGLMDWVRWERADLVGMSRGAHVALRAAVRHPHRVRRMVLCSLGARRSSAAQEMISRWGSLLGEGDQEGMVRAFLDAVFSPGFRKIYRSVWDQMVTAVVQRNSAEGLAAAVAALASDPAPLESAVEVTCPTLVMSGGLDPLVSPQSAEELAMLCGGRHHLLANAGHSITAEMPERVHARIRAFLQNA